MVPQVSLSSINLAVRLTGTSGVGGTPVGASVTAAVVPPAVGLGGLGLLATGVAGSESALGLNPGLLVSATGGVMGVRSSDENEISSVREGVGGPDGG